jgi:protein-disulfide isomerase
MKHYLAFIIVGVFAAFPGSPLLCQTKPTHRPNISADHIRGNPDASVTLEEFGDFECPSCKNLATFLDQLVKEYHPRVRLIFRNFPLPMHQIANDAALAAEAAALQGRYWEMHGKLFQEQAAWERHYERPATV